MKIKTILMLTAPMAMALVASHAAATSSGNGPVPPPVSTVTPLPDGSFRFVSVAVLDEKPNRAWRTIRDIEKVVEIALPGIAENFQWLNGGSVRRVPSDFQFDALGSSVHEQVSFRSERQKLLEYRLVTPALGIESYVATMQVTRLGNHRSTLTFSRVLRFADPASVPTFAELFHQEAINIQTYFSN